MKAPTRTFSPALVRGARAPGTTGPVRALALPQLPLDRQAIAQGAAGVGLSVAAAMTMASQLRQGQPLRLRSLDAAGGSAAMMGTLLATHHAFVAQGAPGWLLPAAVMGTFGVAWGHDQEDKMGVATVGTLWAWVLVACFEGMLNYGLPMAAALPLLLSLPAYGLGEIIPEEIVQRQTKESYRQ